jgi:hypothetical protein
MAERVLNWECEICGLRLKNVTPPVRHKCVSRGLGDTIAKITHATGIAQVVKKVSGGKDCGCRGRQEKLNQMFPYKDHDNGE